MMQRVTVQVSIQVSMAGVALLAALIAPTLSRAQPLVTHDDRQWASMTNGADVPWQEANDWCEALELGGFSDWRLPTLDELASLHDPRRAGNVRITAPLPQETCCLWSSTSTAELQPEDGHFYVDRSGEPEEYFWGYLYSEEGTRYYSVNFFPDGQALCTRDE